MFAYRVTEGNPLLKTSTFLLLPWWPDFWLQLSLSGKKQKQKTCHNMNLRWLRFNACAPPRKLKIMALLWFPLCLKWSLHAEDYLIVDVGCPAVSCMCGAILCHSCLFLKTSLGSTSGLGLKPGSCFLMSVCPTVDCGHNVDIQSRCVAAQTSLGIFLDGTKPFHFFSPHTSALKCLVDTWPGGTWDLYLLIKIWLNQHTVLRFQG